MAKKKKLVFDQDKAIEDLSPKYLITKRWWICEIVAEIEDGGMEELELRPKTKLRLTDLLEVIRKFILEELPDDSVDCSYRVFEWK